MNFHFLDDDFDNLYRTEQRMSKMFGYFSFLAIFISCLGLIGLIIIYGRTQDKRDRNQESKRSEDHIEIFFMSVKRIYSAG